MSVLSRLFQKSQEPEAPDPVHEGSRSATASSESSPMANLPKPETTAASGGETRGVARPEAPSFQMRERPPGPAAGQDGSAVAAGGRATTLLGAAPPKKPGRDETLLGVAPARKPGRDETLLGVAPPSRPPPAPGPAAQAAKGPASASQRLVPPAPLPAALALDDEDDNGPLTLELGTPTHAMGVS